LVLNMLIYLHYKLNSDSNTEDYENMGLDKTYNQIKKEGGV